MSFLYARTFRVMPAVRRRYPKCLYVGESSNHRYRGLRFPAYSRSPLRLGELRRRNAYEIVRIPRAGSASTLGRPRVHTHTCAYTYTYTRTATALTAVRGVNRTRRSREEEEVKDLPICLIKSIRASTKRGIRVIILAWLVISVARLCARECA